jgi:hypothetical protein
MEIGLIIDILRSHPETAALKPGDHLTVKVLEIFDDRRALVDLGRFRAMADITFPVAAGEELQVRVQETRGQLRLQLISPPGDASEGAGRLLGPVRAAAMEALRRLQVRIDQAAGALQRRPVPQTLPGELGPVLDGLRLFLEPLAPGSDPGALARRLKEFCEDSGLFLEHRLAAALRTTADPAGEGARRILAADLKARLAFIKKFFDGAAGRQLALESREVAALAKAAIELLAEIRAGQEQMARPAAAAQPFQMVHFALPMPDGPCRAGLKIAYRRRPAAGRPEGHRAAILLRLDRMGAVRADLILLNAGLNVSIFVSDAGMKDEVRRHVNELREALAPFFQNVAVQVSVSPRKIDRFESEEWRPGGESQVDLRV